MPSHPMDVITLNPFGRGSFPRRASPDGSARPDAGTTIVTATSSPAVRIPTREGVAFLAADPWWGRAIWPDPTTFRLLLDLNSLPRSVRGYSCSCDRCADRRRLQRFAEARANRGE